MTYIPRKGDFFLTSSRSRIGGLVRWLQAIIGDYTPFTHAGVITTDQDSAGHQDIVEAMPGGAKLSDLSKYRSDPNTIYSRFDLTDAQRDAVATAAIGYIDTKYSWLEYLYLAMAHYGLRTEWIKNKIKDSGHMICSQQVVQCYTDAGIDLFTDGRIPEEVVPGDLASLLLHSATAEALDSDV